MWGWIIFGLIVGIVARFLMPGRDPAGFVATAVLGIVGALLGGFLGRSVGWYREGEPVVSGWPSSGPWFTIVRPWPIFLESRLLADPNPDFGPDDDKRILVSGPRRHAAGWDRGRTNGTAV